jgi:hypothetical protein
MKHRIHTVAVALALVLLAAAGTATAGDSAAKPGFRPGTWNGTGVLATTTETVADLTVRTSGTAKFTLTVSKGGRVTGKGTWTVTQIGTGSVKSTIKGVATVKFSGTATDVRFSGTQVVTTWFGDVAHSAGTTFTRGYTGRLVIKKAGSCRATGGHTFDDGTFSWKALLNGVTCR